MKFDEFSFFNQQLAAMLRDGIPLEGAMQRLSAEMRRGSLRDELLLLQAALAKGTPLGEALKPRQLPELYKRMILVGVKSGDLPGALTMLADYFEQQANLWSRLKGLMVYPILVLLTAFVLSCFLAYILGAFIWNNLEALVDHPSLAPTAVGLWMSPVLLGLALVALLIGVLASPAREKLRWRLPAFREASLARVASAMWLLLKNGVQFDDALALVEQLEKGTCAGQEIAGWRQKLASGRGKFAELASPGRAFPHLFIWTITQAGEDLTAGFQRAAGLYQGRAIYRTELLLYSLLPCSILVLAAMIIAQIQPVFAALMGFIRMLSGDTGMG
jgi:type II secretory pathway component PulF